MRSDAEQDRQTGTDLERTHPQPQAQSTDPIRERREKQRRQIAALASEICAQVERAEEGEREFRVNIKLIK